MLVTHTHTYIYRSVDRQIDRLWSLGLLWRPLSLHGGPVLSEATIYLALRCCCWEIWSMAQAGSRRISIAVAIMPSQPSTLNRPKPSPLHHAMWIHYVLHKVWDAWAQARSLTNVCTLNPDNEPSSRSHACSPRPYKVVGYDHLWPFKSRV